MKKLAKSDRTPAEHATEVSSAYSYPELDRHGLKNWGATNLGQSARFQLRDLLVLGQRGFSTD